MTRAATISLTVAAALLLVLELAVRAIGIEPRGDYIFDSATCYLGWADRTHDRNSHGELTHIVDTDEHGFRIAPGERRCDTDARRCGVLVLGDSFTEGLYVSADQTFPAVTEQRFGSEGFAVRVDNGGMRGHTILQQRIAALGRWRDLGHPVVIVQHTANDLRDLTEAMRQGCDLHSPPAARFTSTRRKGRLRKLRLYALAQAVDVRLAAGPAGWLLGHAATDPPSEEECRVSADEYARQLIELATSLQAEGRHLLHLMLEPFTCESGGREPDWQVYRRGLADRLERLGGSTLDATDVIGAPGGTLAPLDSHPSPAGHSAIAGRIVERLERLGWLNGCRLSSEDRALGS